MPVPMAFVPRRDSLNLIAKRLRDERNSAIAIAKDERRVPPNKILTSISFHEGDMILQMAEMGKEIRRDDRGVPQRKWVTMTELTEKEGYKKLHQITDVKESFVDDGKTPGMDMARMNFYRKKNANGQTRSYLRDEMECDYHNQKNLGEELPSEIKRMLKEATKANFSLAPQQTPGFVGTPSKFGIITRRKGASSFFQQLPPAPKSGKRVADPTVDPTIEPAAKQQVVDITGNGPAGQDQGWIQEVGKVLAAWGCSQEEFTDFHILNATTSMIVFIVLIT